MDAFFVWLSTNPLAAAAVGILVVALTVLFVTAYIQGREISFWPPRIGPKPFNTDVASTNLQQAGIVASFANLEACKADMQKEFEKARYVRLLLQLGRREFGDRKTSLFWPLAQQKNRTGVEIRVLRASEQSPFLSQARASFRGTPVEQWYEDIHRVQEEIRRLRETYHVNIEDREHAEPFLWRIFIFDEVAYVSAYLYRRDNDIKAMVYKIRKGDNSLFSIIDTYFEYLWKKYDPADTSDLNSKWANWQ